MNAESKPADYPTFITNYANLSGADLSLSRKLLHSLPPSYSIAKFISLGYLYLNARQTDSASFYLNKAMEEYHRLSGAISINTGNNLYALKMCLDHSQGRHVIAGENVTANDSINNVVEMQRMLNAELAHSRTKIEQHLLKERISRQRSVTILIVVIFIGMTIFFLYDRNAKKKYISLRKQLDRSRVNQIISESQADEVTDITKVWAGRFNLCLQGFRGTEWMKRLQVLDGQESSEYLPSKSRNRLSSALMEYFTDVIVTLKPSWQINLGAIKNIRGWDIQLQITDIIKTANNSMFTYGSQMVLDKWNYSDSRALKLTLRYRFNSTATHYKGISAGSSERNRF